MYLLNTLRHTKMISYNDVFYNSGVQQKGAKYVTKYYNNDVMTFIHFCTTKIHWIQFFYLF